MSDQQKSKEQLIQELSELRQQLETLKASPPKKSYPTLSIPKQPFDLPLQTRKSSYPGEGDFKNLVEKSPDAIVRFDKDLRFLYANSITIEVIGIPITQCIGKTIYELKLTGKNHHSWKAHVESVFATKKSVAFEADFTNYKGRHFYYHARLVPEFSKDGSVPSVLCTFRNISELKQAELELRASEERNGKLLSSLPDILFFLTNEGVYLDYHVTNPHLLYKPHHSRIGKHVSEVLPAKQSAQIMAAVKKAIKSSKMQFLEYQLPINDVVCTLEGRIITYNSDSVLVIIRDITELKHLRQELTRLDQLNLVGEMAASIGHEVRNPMTTVRGFLQLLSNKEECSKFQEYFSLMIDELDRANSIISEFLSLAKNKKVELEKQNLNTIIKTIAPLIESNAIMSNKYLHLELQSVPDLLLDSQEIRQLILNLVHNGLEAMPPHTTINIASFVQDDQIILAIQDKGTGIPPEAIEKLGTPFFTTKETGTGLGLAVCYSIAARHKATITFDTGSQGTTFYIKFNQ